MITVDNLNFDDYRYTLRSIEEDYNETPLREKIWNVFCAVIKSILFYLSMIPKLFFRALEECVYPTVTKHEWNVENNKGLYVIIHGLNGSPRMTASNYVKQIKKDRPATYEIRAPHVYKKGNCSLRKASLAIVRMVRSYIKKNPGKPIHLIGTSNGARIAARVEVALRNKDVNIRVTAIAGVFFGSKRIEALKRIKIASLVLHKDIIEDFSVGSKRAQRLIRNMQQPVTVGTRSYEFYGTPNDESIPNFSSCFPKEIPGAIYHPLVKGESHVSLWNSIRLKVLKDSYEWMEAQTIS
jgi:hypothetical protein